ncbi:hypothetical protein P775_27570 [Puniceibacterium antarcticum]|uniref:peptide-methionine (R)-S-oxide reductase n=1 Tax=Puniceibacterium antarcticum TaxID=1206336 RepID=A0A2G8QWR1_9RHOB|nr:peptide-methionine (R)-S-oxide reductase MsrB [Puniceibacterium antarcticum]PIL13726.1 hypothetical protein P775_27570 [Puniceibacterium antarcticum]
MKRRHFLSAATIALGFSRQTALAEQSFEVTRTDAEWRAMLSSSEYKVMRKEGTERAFTSPLNEEKGTGTFHCRGCDLALYKSETKFDSGTGWPSFYAAVDGAVGNKSDISLFGVRTEEHCIRCGSHLGHVFDDGPKPTGKRHCINGVCLVFRPA